MVTGDGIARGEVGWWVVGDGGLEGVGVEDESGFFLLKDKCWFF